MVYYGCILLFFFMHKNKIFFFSIASFFLLFGITESALAAQYTASQCSAIGGAYATNESDCPTIDPSYFKAGDYLNASCTVSGVCCAGVATPPSGPACAAVSCTSLPGGQCNIACGTGYTPGAGTCSGGQQCCIPGGGAAPVAPAGGAMNYTLMEKVPGTGDLSGADLSTYIRSLYNIALIIVTLSAVLMLSIGGFMYLTSAGNTAAMGSAKEVITDSIIGLVIALCAWLILYVINPDLVDIRITSFAPITATAPGAPGADVPPGPPISDGTCPGCVDVPIGLVKPVGQGCASPGPCKLSQSFLSKVQSISVTPDWWITEAWPPTVNHSSSCHSNGGCADINFKNGVTDPASVKTLYMAILGANLNAVYETFGDCTPYRSIGIPCSRFSTTTGSHFHVKIK